jgi:DNA-binding transcriptional LysR family regulator
MTGAVRGSWYLPQPWRNSAGPRLEEVQAEMSALAEMSDKPAGTIRITTSDHAAKTILLPKLAPLFSGFHLYYASRKQASPAFSLIVDALRYRQPARR